MGSQKSNRHVGPLSVPASHLLQGRRRRDLVRGGLEQASPLHVGLVVVPPQLRGFTETRGLAQSLFGGIEGQMRRFVRRQSRESCATYVVLPAQRASSSRGHKRFGPQCPSGKPRDEKVALDADRKIPGKFLAEAEPLQVFSLSRCPTGSGGVFHLGEEKTANWKGIVSLKSNSIPRHHRVDCRHKKSGRVSA